MDTFTFGITVLIVGMGGTVLTLGCISLLMVLLKKIFPLEKDKGEQPPTTEG